MAEADFLHAGKDADVSDIDFNRTVVVFQAID